MEKKILRLLIVDDSPDDTEAAVAAVRKGGYMIKSQRVQDLAGMQVALDKGSWDVVLSEFALPHFGAQMVHDLLRNADLDIPFIVLTREISDTDLDKIMRAGARDVILKTQFARLAPVIAREMEVAAMMKAYKNSRVALEEMESKHRAVIEGSREAICYSQDGMHVNVNKAYLALFGYQDAAELEGVPVMNLIDKSDQPRFKEMLRGLAKGETPAPQELTGVKQDGTRLTLEFAVSSIVLEGQPCSQIVVADVSRRKAVESKLQYLNQHDALTGLFNRHYFLQELGKAVDRGRRGEGDSAVFHVEVEQLKEINDALGYAAGDRLLIRIAKLLREHLGETAMVARLGGDELAAILPPTPEPTLRKLATAVQATLNMNPFNEGGKTFQCAYNINVAVIDRNTESAQALLSRTSRSSHPRAPTPAATASVPQAAPAVVPPPPTPTPAAAPKEPAPVTTPAPRPAVLSASDSGWKERIAVALTRNDFTLAYQPIINLHGDAAEFYEVLVRMNDPGGALIQPAEFMPAAEKSGLSAAIDRWVVRHAIEALATLHREGRQASFFINVCPSALQDRELLPLIGQTLFATGLKHSAVIFEADESAIAAAPAQAGTFIKAINQIGCRVCVDNFGAKAGALSHLRGLAIQFIKIEGSLVRNLTNDAASQETLKAVVEVAKTLNAYTVAKSVEKAENLAMLWNFGLDYVQGNYFQEADTQLGYDYTGETTLASDAVSTPTWANR
jgi:multidomain signaling protein FimX